MQAQPLSKDPGRADPPVKYVNPGASATVNQTTDPGTSADSAGRLTAEQYFFLGPEGRSELLSGEVVLMSPTGSRHGELVLNIAFLLRKFLADQREGLAVAGDSGFVLRRDPDTVRAPDVAFVRAGRIPEGGLPDGFFPGAPDIAVEVVSPTDRWQDVEAKVAEYLDAGTLEVWVVDPNLGRVRVHLGGEDGRVLELSGDDTLKSGTLPGFEVPVRSIFE